MGAHANQDMKLSMHFLEDSKWCTDNFVIILGKHSSNGMEGGDLKINVNVI